MNEKSKKRLIGVFSKGNSISRKVTYIFNQLNCRQIFVYEVIDKNQKEKTYLITFFLNNYNKEKLQDFKLKPVTLNRKENNVLYTINGMNNYMSGKNVSELPEEERKKVIEDNKTKKFDVTDIGQNVLITHSKTGTGFNLNKIIIFKIYDNRNLNSNYITKDTNEQNNTI